MQNYTQLLQAFNDIRKQQTERSLKGFSNVKEFMMWQKTICEQKAEILKKMETIGKTVNQMEQPFIINN